MAVFLCYSNAVMWNLEIRDSITEAVLVLAIGRRGYQVPTALYSGKSLRLENRIRS